MKMVLCFYMFALCVAAQAAAPSGPALKKEPSANKGKTGKYKCSTSRAGYDYWVYVPPSYSEDNPAGLHLFFHGQGSQKSAEWFEHWFPFCNDHNLIAINMQYQDGDNTKDTPGKVAAAREAMAQTFADYKIVAGRGTVASFSGGGVPHGLYFSESSKARGADWPFNHLALYSSNYRHPVPSGACSMSWFITTGAAEWDMAQLGQTNTARTVELLAAATKGGDADVFFKVIKGKGHSIDPAEVAESVKGFRRSDLAMAPFIYEPDHSEAPLASIARQANALQLKPALDACESVLKGKAGDAVKKKAEKIKERILDRAKRIVVVMKELSEQDPALCHFYSMKFAPQVSSLPEAKELQGLVQAARGKPAFVRSLGFQQPFASAMKSMIATGGKLNATHAPLLEDIKKTCGENSQYGRMASDYLLLEPSAK